MARDLAQHRIDSQLQQQLLHIALLEKLLAEALSTMDTVAELIASPPRSRSLPRRVLSWMRFSSSRLSALEKAHALLTIARLQILRAWGPQL